MKRVGQPVGGTQGNGAGPKRSQCAQTRGPEALEREVMRLSARVEQLEREREQLDREREQLDREREQLESFAAMAAHELLKPLVMNEAYATMLGERLGHGLDLESRRDIDAMIRISSRVRVLVEALLQDAREAGKPLRRQQVDLAEVLRDCVRMLETEIDSMDARLDIDPMPVVEGDPALLSGVFSNLLANALKYGARRGSDIRVSAMRSEAGWTFGVESPGPVIGERASERIFEPWERGPGERRTRGFGLGLAIVRQIVERHGGEVGVTPTSESSNRFYFTLPA